MPLWAFGVGSLPYALRRRTILWFNRVFLTQSDNAFWETSLTIASVAQGKARRLNVFFSSSFPLFGLYEHLKFSRPFKRGFLASFQRFRSK